MGETAPEPGALMAAEIAEQPQVWARLLQEGGGAVAGVAAAVRARRPRFVLLVARGTSDHAALYAKYLVEVRLGLPAGLASPSTVTAYGARPDLSDVLLVAVSQSGGSPDLVRYVEVGRQRGATTVAVTNAASSSLAQAAEFSVDVLAGPERAVAATKSYTAQLLALLLLVEGLRGDVPDLRGLPGWGAEVLALEPVVARAAERLRYAQRLVVTGRGYAYPTAREAALKLMETCYVSAHAYSGADLLHGPLAMVDATVPVLAVAPSGTAGEAITPILPRLRETGADVLTVGSEEAALGANAGLVLPDGVPEVASPLLEILPFQLLALHLARLRGGDPDSPRGLRKVTETL
ncbi:SIS domain-containing protein [Geodermatophilus marinus]|uniref:SIS domain-containing protein n=1 Tax=Geodermatophilus sp. LHW52908 TaxID=2303986 RepID=UPI001F1E0A45|nr:SIS domain-containing protein [Geodermatophilus sp. LHW52908]